jgi:uncharacterized secreted protein with C-terminal beta-propeller domain
MPTNITISGLGGASPFDVYVCDSTITTCVYVSTITPASLPYVFEMPSVYSSLTNFVVKVVDNNNCIKTQSLSV